MMGKIGGETMLKTYSVAQMREAERRAADYGVTLSMLMENAGHCLARTARTLCPEGPIVIVCGRGNNGGDGYVCATALRRAGVEVRVWGIRREALAADSLSGAAAASYERLGGRILPFTPEVTARDFGACGLVVDAVFGTGLGRPVSGIYAWAIRQMGGAGAPVLACDVPSGVDAATGQILGDAVRASVTLMLGLAKPACLLAPGRAYFGEARVADIGLPPALTASL
ncbi:MAG: NAD(P)H-hydrate epimerase [Oscillospiraceae bacterium]|jgi:hydroxyethylthiazole kinase-like uncharacterized protein yjeF|nr:NAD(P)H-hydrate epimerase [Oscillospiraceae bacterium]